VIRLSEIEKKKNVVIANVEKKRAQLINLPSRNVKEFDLQKLISTLLAEKLPLGLNRIFK
jgi:hypothetical protein